MAESLKHFTDEDFDEKVSQGIVLIDFYADWCGPCRMLTPIVEALAQEMEGKAIIAKVDTDKAPLTAAKFEVTSIPTLILFKGGEPVKKVVGLRDLEGLRKMVTEAL